MYVRYQRPMSGVGESLASLIGGVPTALQAAKAASAQSELATKQSAAARFFGKMKIPIAVAGFTVVALVVNKVISERRKR